ncbi:hypothetical protein LL912_13885 [Niabella sp. CC-SYL272]|uniref:hypothetical protein n=1 Tax=Niabella agricola TaxID=2891571 RepID=UPI001F2D3B22|nr:hypothetical protein [Niabella agricola]MCF3109866.1 hypothetical protein [Niabella agricola]
MNAFFLSCLMALCISSLNAQTDTLPPEQALANKYQQLSERRYKTGRSLLISAVGCSVIGTVFVAIGSEKANSNSNEWLAGLEETVAGVIFYIVGAGIGIASIPVLGAARKYKRSAAALTPQLVLQRIPLPAGPAKNQLSAGIVLHF